MQTRSEVVSIIAGPNGVDDLGLLEQPYFYLSMENMVEYKPSEVGKVLSTHPNIKIETSPKGDELEFWNWKALYKTNSCELKLTMSLFVDFFLSVDFEGICPKSVIFELIQYLKSNGFPYLWFVISSGEMLTERAFENRFGHYNELQLIPPK